MNLQALQTWTVKPGMTIQRVDGTRTFDIEEMRAVVKYPETQYETVEIEVDMRNIETGELHEHISVIPNFFQRYTPAPDFSELDQN